MLWPCHETLRQVAPHLSDELLAPHTVANLHALASELSEAMSSYYLEFRLASGASQVDFSACITAAHGGRSVLKQFHGAPGLPADEPAWHRARAFLECWATPGSALHEQLPLVWLEFDRANEGARRAPVPCVNFCVDPTFLSRRGAPSKACHPNTLRHQPFFDVGLEHLLGQPLPDGPRRMLRRCFDALPPGGHIDYLAVMLTRAPAALKANIFIPRAALANYLSRIDWPGDWSALERVLDTLLPSGPSAPVRLDVTVGETVSPRLGIECFAGGEADEPGKRLLLERLVERGLCCPRKRDGLLHWPGEAQVIFASQSWRTRLRRTWYLKLVCHGGPLTEAKAYLGFTPGLCSPFAPATPSPSSPRAGVEA